MSAHTFIRTLSLSTCLIASALFSQLAAAEWQLNNAQSNLNFVSIKKGSVGEIHTFDQLAGSISPSGQVNVDIDLASVNTAIEIRDQRMQEHLFQTGKFAKASLTAQVDPAKYADLATGARADVALEAELALHGERKPLNLDVTVVRLSPTQLMVVSKKPVLVNAGDYQLVDGVNALMEIAKLPSIAHAIPVTFVLSFDATEN